MHRNLSIPYGGVHILFPLKVRVISTASTIQISVKSPYILICALAKRECTRVSTEIFSRAHTYMITMMCTTIVIDSYLKNKKVLVISLILILHIHSWYSTSAESFQSNNSFIPQYNLNEIFCSPDWEFLILALKQLLYKIWAFSEL